MITTSRFVLTALTPNDATERYRSWLDDEATSTYIVSAKSPNSMADLRAYIETRAARDDILFLGIFTRDTHEHIGNIKYEPVNVKERYAVMGILIGEPSWRGRGVAAEVIRTSGLWLRDRHGIKEVILGIEREHRYAIKAYQKVGFRAELTDKIPVDPVKAIAMIWHLDPETRA